VYSLHKVAAGTAEVGIADRQSLQDAGPGRLSGGHTGNCHLVHAVRYTQPYPKLESDALSRRDTPDSQIS
jgi:hypothetical protein